MQQQVPAPATSMTALQASVLTPRKQKTADRTTGSARWADATLGRQLGDQAFTTSMAGLVLAIFLRRRRREQSHCAVGLSRPVDAL